jgi:hypothetical protein
MTGWQKKEDRTRVPELSIVFFNPMKDCGISRASQDQRQIAESQKGGRG